MSRLSAAKTAVRRHVEATATAAAIAAVASTAVAVAASTAAALLGSTCTTTGISGAVEVTSSTAAASAAAAILSAPAVGAATSSRTAFAGDECMLGLLGKSLSPLFWGQVGVTRAYHADDLVPISVFHGLQGFFDEGILVGQRANKTCVQHCVRNPTDRLLIPLVVYILEIMKCGAGVTVGGNCKLVELAVQSLGRHLTLWVMPLFLMRSKTSRGDLHLFRIALSASL